MNDMTELKVGSLVRSKCGRDRKRIFLVVKIDADNPVSPVYIADGKLRKLRNPKKKNPLHIIPAGEISEDEKSALKCGFSDEIIAQIVEKYDWTCKE